MKYLEVVDRSATDLYDEMNGNVTIPSIRLIKDKGFLSMRTLNSDLTAEAMELINLFKESSKSSEITFEDYVNGIADGTYVSNYAASITNNLIFSDFARNNGVTSELIDNFPNRFNYSVKLQNLLCVFDSYNEAENTLIDIVSYTDVFKDSEDFISISYEQSGETLSSSTIVNAYEQYLEKFDFYNDEKLDKRDLIFLKSIKSLFPEFLESSTYNNASELFNSEDNDYLVSDVVDILLGFSSYNSSFDFNENGYIDIEDVNFILSSQIFGPIGDEFTFSFPSGPRRLPPSGGTSSSSSSASTSGSTTLTRTGTNGGTDSSSIVEPQNTPLTPPTVSHYLWQRGVKCSTDVILHYKSRNANEIAEDTKKILKTAGVVAGRLFNISGLGDEKWYDGVVNIVQRWVDRKKDGKTDKNETPIYVKRISQNQRTSPSNANWESALAAQTGKDYSSSKIELSQLYQEIEQTGQSYYMVITNVTYKPVNKEWVDGGTCLGECDENGNLI